MTVKRKKGHITPSQGGKMRKLKGNLSTEKGHCRTRQT